MGTVKIGTECCNNCIHWECRSRDIEGDPPSEVRVYTDSNRCSISRSVTEWRDCCGMFKHIGGVQNTFRADRDAMLTPGEAYLKAVTEQIENRRRKREEARIQEENTVTTCSLCDGTGRSRCTSCGGRGKKDCSECDGKGGFTVTMQIKEHGKKYSKQTVWLLNTEVDGGFWDKGWDWDKDPGLVAKFSDKHVVCSKTCKVDGNASAKRKIQEEVLKVSMVEGDFHLPEGLSDAEEEKVLESYLKVFNNYIGKCKDVEESAKKWGDDGWWGHDERIKEATLTIVDTPCFVQVEFTDRYGFERTALVNLASGNAYLNEVSEESRNCRIAELEARANDGDVEAQNMLGRMYAGDSGVCGYVPKDLAKAAGWFRNAAKAGDADAMDYLERLTESCLQEAKKILDADDPDYETAESLLLEIAEAGNAEAQYHLALVYRDADEPIKSGEKYGEWLRKAAVNGCKDAQNVMKEASEQTDRWVAAVKNPTPHQPFDMHVFVMAGMEYRQGKTLAGGLPHTRDILKAIELFEKGFEAGDARCARELSDIFETGDGVQVDLTKAHEWMLKAAEKGDEVAMVLIGKNYLLGHGVDKDEMEAVKWFRRAADAGSVYGQSSLGDCFKYGWGVAVDGAKAAEWYEKAIAPEAVKLSGGTESEVEPSYDAMCELAEILMVGDGVEKDGERSVELLKKAAESDHAKAQYMLGGLLINPSSMGVTCIDQDLAEGVKWMQKSSEQSFGMAECAMAAFYVQGIGVAKDLAKAKELYMQALDHGGLIKEMEEDAKEELAKLEAVLSDRQESDDEYPGMDVNASDEDKAKFRELYKKAKDGDAEAQADLAQAFYFGWEGAVKDYGKMVAWFRKSAEQGYALAQRRLGICLRDGEGTDIDCGEAVKWFEKSALQGDVVAQLQLGEMYFYGEGVEEDNDEAVKWYRMAADQGDEEGQHMLGICYYEGYGVEEDGNEAVKWFEKSAEQDYSKAQCMLGDCHRLGRGGLEKDDMQALEWYKRAAKSGNAVAEYWVAEFYEAGRGGLEKDQVTSFEWRLKSAKHGDVDAINGVGWAYQKGLGTEIDANQAVEWYKKGVDKGSAAAMNNLAKCYEDAFGVDADIDRAFELFQQSADKGFSRGCYHIGRFYENGLGVDADIDEAKEWYQKAADKGDKDAKAALERLG